MRVLGQKNCAAEALVWQHIVDEEVALLRGVSTLLEEHPYIPPPSEKDIVAALLKLREDMPGAKLEDRASLMEQYNRNIALLTQIREARQAPQVDPDSPYFAHVRLRERGGVRDLCIGKATRIQDGVRIIDWRNAPISRVFYRYQQGEEYEERVGDVVLEGEVVARRTVSIRRGHLDRIQAPEGIFTRGAKGWARVEREDPRLAGGEGAALRAHGIGAGESRRLGTDLGGSSQRVDKRLPDIAGLIDAEQFALITRPTSGFVVIRGTAGSGKTTVALHRIAWLAFEDSRFDSPRTLFMVFSKALRDYVGHVLPALGVHKAQIRTFDHWATELVRRHFSKLPRRIRGDTPELVIRLKLHPALLLALEEQRADVRGPANGDQAIDDWSSVLTDPQRLRRALERTDPEAFTDAQLERIAQYCRDRHEELVARFDGDREAEPELDVEDYALLLRAWQLRVGPLRAKRSRKLTYAHIAVDEVQDFTPTEVRVLLDCLDHRRSITLAGDTHQHISAQGGFASWAAFFRHLGVPGTEVNTLRISYRCSQQIASFAVSLLDGLQEDDTPPMTTRTGPDVELFRFTDHGACVAFLADVLCELQRVEPMASVALLTPSRSTSRLYHSGLNRSDVPRLRLVDSQNFTFAPGVEVTEIQQVKGLEFDYVLLVEVSAANFPDNPAARRLLHVGATRAIHQLWLTSVGSPSPIIASALDGD